jgi:hypothetical protein
MTRARVQDPERWAQHSFGRRFHSHVGADPLDSPACFRLRASLARPVGVPEAAPARRALLDDEEAPVQGAMVRGAKENEAVEDLMENRPVES